MNEGMLPVIYNEHFADGTLIKAMPRCLEKFDKDACAKFYKRIGEKPDGFYQCPAGYTTYKRTLDGVTYYYSGLRIKNFYDKRKKENNNDNLILTQNFFEKLLQEDDNIRKIKADLCFEKEIHKDLLHDVRKLDGLIKNKAEEIERQYQNPSGDLYDVIQKVRNMSAMEELITCKYSVYDLVSNIGVLSMGAKTKVSVYKKFDKVRYILLNYKNKKINIDFVGITEFCYHVNLVYFEVLPFLLLENAVKYSSENHDVVVNFTEHSQGLDISVESYGPYCPKEEIPMLFEKNYRGRVAQKVTREGTGIGLYLVKEICVIHGIKIDISTNYAKKSNGIPYGIFKVNLHF